jgi:hypothetical protein
MGDLKVWASLTDADETELVVAASEEDAQAAIAEHIGDKPEDVARRAWQEIPADRVIEIGTDDGRGVLKKTAAEWVASDGRGFLCSTEW